MSAPEAPWQAARERLRRTLAPAGFDLIEGCSVGAYNEAVEGALRLEDWGSPAHVAFVVGNTRALWPVFLRALRRDRTLRAASDPLDRYTEREIAAAVESLGVRAAVRWAHDTGPRLVAIQRLAHVAGLAYLAQSHLSVHPTFGAWIALRAAITLELPGPARGPAWGEPPCSDCARRCAPAFEQARARAVGASDHRPWLACREACPRGREHRYSDEQIEYHYGRDRARLLALVERDDGPALETRVRREQD